MGEYRSLVSLVSPNWSVETIAVAAHYYGLVYVPITTHWV